MHTPPYDTDLDLDLGVNAPTRVQRLRQRLADVPRPTHWSGYVFLTLGVAFIGAVAYLLWVVANKLVDLIGWGADTGTGLHAWVTGGPITSTVTAPVRAYLNAHAVGLPATGGQLWTTWLVIAAILFVFAVGGARGARIGWVLLGVLTTAMVYAGTAATGRYLAAGLTTAVWAVLSIVALRRIAHTDHDITVINTIDRPEHAETDTADVDA